MIPSAVVLLTVTMLIVIIAADALMTLLFLIGLVVVTLRRRSRLYSSKAVFVYFLFAIFFVFVSYACRIGSWFHQPGGVLYRSANTLRLIGGILITIVLRCVLLKHQSRMTEWFGMYFSVRPLLTLNWLHGVCLGIATMGGVFLLWDSDEAALAGYSILLVGSITQMTVLFTLCWLTHKSSRHLSKSGVEDGKYWQRTVVVLYIGFLLGILRTGYLLGFNSLMLRHVVNHGWATKPTAYWYGTGVASWPCEGITIFMTMVAVLMLRPRKLENVPAQGPMILKEGVVDNVGV